MSSYIPDSLPFEEACLTEPCCVAYNAVIGNSHIKPGDQVIVIGPGTIGILCVLLLSCVELMLLLQDLQQMKNV
jgi:threonine dehydrogenase-like Zn-dependent dehydrogenase